MDSLRGVLLAVFLAMVNGEALLRAQTEEIPNDLRIFLDCAARCDEDHIRREIEIVTYVRNREDADIHVLVTSEPSGSGGIVHTVQFIGQRAFSGRDQTLTHTSPETATEAERRAGLTETLKRGLVPYISETALKHRIRVTFLDGAATDPQRGRTVEDPWNLWVFRTSFSGTFTGESSDRGRSLRASAAANRTSDEWRLSVSSSLDYRNNVFEISHGDTFRSSSRGFDVNALAVNSLSHHWSAGIVVNAGSSTFLNYDLRSRTAAGVEYNFFPYSESTNQLFTLQYTVGLSSFDYREETIFGKRFERLADHRAGVLFTMLKPWGTAGIEGSFSQFLTLRDKYNLSVLGQTNLRIARGFSFNVFVSVSRTRDQLYLARGESTVEEILVREQQRATAYRYSSVVGVTYSFGSVFNNVVNPRFGRSAEDAPD